MYFHYPWVNLQTLQWLVILFNADEAFIMLPFDKKSHAISEKDL